uniref:Uncharacterized protein n=1 Tax=Cacopsylla melanoneura TaxID=428564 RepID=A0A8D8U2N0_9HEMI
MTKQIKKNGRRDRRILLTGGGEGGRCHLLTVRGKEKVLDNRRRLRHYIIRKRKTNYSTPFLSHLCLNLPYYCPSSYGRTLSLSPCPSIIFPPFLFHPTLHNTK